MRLPLPPRPGPPELEHLTSAIAGATDPILLVGSCAGLDLATDLEDAEAWRELSAVFRALFRAPPTAALATGPVVGIGVGLVCACDVVLATPEATFALPELLYGLVPGGAVPAVRGRIGARGVRELALGATALDATEALRVGLVDRVVPGEGNILDHLARLDPEAVRTLRELIQPDYLADLDAGLAASRQRVPSARGRLARWALGELPWPE